MEDIQNFGLFITLILLLIITPGPDMIYTLTRGISQGKKAGVISGLGVGIGVLVHTIFAALGLSVILQTSATAFMIVKYAGAAYLIYLGVKTLLDKKNSFELERSEALSTRKLFINGLLSNVLNPKIALFFIAFLPQFVKAGSSPVPFLMLGLVFTVFTIITYLSFGFFSGYVGGFVQKNQKLSFIVQKASGVIMTLLGVKLAFVKQ